LILSNADFVSGTGLGTEPTLLTIQESRDEIGCVSSTSSQTRSIFNASFMRRKRTNSITYDRSMSATLFFWAGLFLFVAAIVGGGIRFKALGVELEFPQILRGGRTLLGLLGVAMIIVVILILPPVGDWSGKAEGLGSPAPVNVKLTIKYDWLTPAVILKVGNDAPAPTPWAKYNILSGQLSFPQGGRCVNRVVLWRDRETGELTGASYPAVNLDADGCDKTYSTSATNVWWGFHKLHE
jgi:hypothetical protein